MTQGKLLLVDDEESVLETMSDDLSEVGFNVVQASNGSEGLHQFVSGEFDLVNSDPMRRPFQKSFPGSYGLGASDVIVKPFVLEDIFEVVNQHIRTSKSG